MTTEFFDDEAVLKISCYLEDGLKHFGVGVISSDVFATLPSRLVDD